MEHIVDNWSQTEDLLTALQTSDSINVHVWVRELKMFTHTQIKNRQKAAIYSQHPQA